MPQLDFSVFPSQMFWLLICFFSMWFVMSKFIIPKTAEMINLRKEKIDGDLEKAAEIKKHVEETIEKYNTALQKAGYEARLSLQKTKDELNDTINRRQAELTVKLNSEIEAGEKKIYAAKEKALQKLEDVSAELAVDILTKLGFGGIKVKDAANALKALKKE